MTKRTLSICLAFLLLLGLPILVMEFAVGRASQRSVAKSFRLLEPEGTKWHLFSYVALGGNYLLMMFYTSVGGWMLAYVFKALSGHLHGVTTQGAQLVFNQLLASPGSMFFWMILIVLISFGICSLGLQNGVERITKLMMSSLFVIILVLAIRSITLPGAAEGLKFYLVPNVEHVKEQGIINVIFAAMGQAFFTLSIGIGSMSIFGSYIGKDRSLTGESLSICFLDTLVALFAGLIIFPACSAFGVNPGEGPGLVFVTLPGIFNQMPFGKLWEFLFFVFMTFAAFSTVLAVFENIVSCGMELTGFNRKKSSIVNMILVALLSMPCVLGFNLWSFDWLGVFGGSFLDFEDFLVSNIWLPLGSLIYLLFCTSKFGWGWKNYKEEANTGKGIKIHNWMRVYLTYILPLIVLFIFAFGIYDKFWAK